MKQFLMGLLVGAMLVETFHVVRARVDTSRRVGNHWMYGSGLASCGQWTTTHAVAHRLLEGSAGGPPSEQAQRYALEMQSVEQSEWVTGFISAMGMMITTRETDTAGIDAAMDKECAANPTVTIRVAAERVLMTLAQ